jgi:hypothetical protein
MRVVNIEGLGSMRHCFADGPDRRGVQEAS